MRNKQGIKLNIALVLLLAAVTLMLSTQALSARTIAEICADPAGDDDKDGFTNGQECAGLTKSSTVAFNYPSCYNFNNNNNQWERNNISRDQCLDPASKDLFVELVPVTKTDTNVGSILPVDPLYYVNCTGQGCLGITAHRIGVGSFFPDLTPISSTIATSDRYVIIGQQKALRVTEVATIGSIFGNTPSPTGAARTPPTASDESRVYTYKIKKTVTDLLKVDNPDTYNDYIRHTIAHELGHSMNLWIKSDVKYNGYHMPPATSHKHMESAVVVQGATFLLPTEFDATDIKGFSLVTVPTP
jgi:hypothetical protein